MGPQNGVMGETFGTDLPVSQPPEEDLAEEKKMARFSKSDEFNRLKEHIEGRIDYYQKYLPDGRAVGPAIPKPEEWMAANLIVTEFKTLLGAYEAAADVVAQDNKRKNA